MSNSAPEELPREKGSISSADETKCPVCGDQLSVEGEANPDGSVNLSGHDHEDVAKQRADEAAAIQEQQAAVAAQVEAERLASEQASVEDYSREQGTEVSGQLAGPGGES